MSHISVFTEVEVKFTDADPLGIVWHGHYVRYFEDGREAFGKKYGLRYLDFFKQGYVIPIIHIHCDYKRPLRYGDVARVETHYRDSASAKIMFDYKITNVKNNELVAHGSTTQVFLFKESYELCMVMPDFFAEWKREMGLLKR